MATLCFGGSTEAAHNEFIHFPTLRGCPICDAAKPQGTPSQSKEHGPPDKLDEPKNFLDQITADHKILNDEDAAREKDKVAMIIQDRFTSWIKAWPLKQTTAKLAKLCLKRFSGPYLQIKYAYSDGSTELYKAFKDLNISHDPSTAHGPQTNGVAERVVRRVKEGTSVCIAQSGFYECWWGYAMECYCFLRNIVDTLANKGKTPFEFRYRSAWCGPIIPFGAYINYLLSAPKNTARTH